MDVCFIIGFTVPYKSTVCKVNMNVILIIDRFPNADDLLSLRNRIGGNKCCAYFRCNHILGSFEVPSCHVIYILSGFWSNSFKIIFLLFRLISISHKRRIPHNVIQLILRHDRFPVNAQCISLGDIDIALEWQEVDSGMYDVLGLLEHLALCDPERCTGDGDGEVVDLDAVELADVHSNRVGDGEGAEADLFIKSQAQGVVFEAAQADISLGEEVATAAGRVEEGEAGEFILIGFQRLLTLLLYGDLLDGVEFLAQRVEKQRVDDFMNVLDRGIVHAAGSACFRVQRTLEHSPKDGWADL